jgi:hypothetical protein
MDFRGSSVDLAPVSCPRGFDDDAVESGVGGLGLALEPGRRIIPDAHRRTANERATACPVRPPRSPPGAPIPVGRPRDQSAAGLRAHLDPLVAFRVDATFNNAGAIQQPWSAVSFSALAEHPNSTAEAHLHLFGAAGPAPVTDQGFADYSSDFGPSEILAEFFCLSRHHR